MGVFEVEAVRVSDDLYAEVTVDGLNTAEWRRAARRLCRRAVESASPAQPLGSNKQAVGVVFVGSVFGGDVPAGDFRRARRLVRKLVAKAVTPEVDRLSVFYYHNSARDALVFRLVGRTDSPRLAGEFVASALKHKSREIKRLK